MGVNNGADERSARCKAEYEGRHYFTRSKDGRPPKEFVIINYNSAADVTIEFLDSGYIKHTNMGNINMGIPDPFEDSPIAFEDIHRQYEGCYFKTNEGDIIQIQPFEALKAVNYKFDDKYGYCGTTTIQNIKKGQVKNPYHRNKFGGYKGVGNYNGNEYKYLYNIWHSMLIRGTGGRKIYEGRGYYYNTNAYMVTGISTDWLCYNNFAEWYISKTSNLNNLYEYDVDKDLLYPFYKDSTRGYKYYSAETCVILPRDVNKYLANHREELEHDQNCRNFLASNVRKYFLSCALGPLEYYVLLYLYDDSVQMAPPQTITVWEDPTKNRMNFDELES